MYNGSIDQKVVRSSAVIITQQSSQELSAPVANQGNNKDSSMSRQTENQETHQAEMSEKNFAKNNSALPPQKNLTKYMSTTDKGASSVVRLGHVRENEKKECNNGERTQHRN